MRIKARFVVAILIATVLSGFQIHAQDTASAKAFLTDVYRHYRGGYRDNSSGIDMDGPHATLYFHSSLVALEKTDIKANAPDIQAIDWDPLCSCQDWDGIWDLKIEIHAESPQRVKASVSFSLSDPKNNATDAARKLEITLVLERGHWRIYDIFDPNFSPPVRQILKNDLASLRLHRAPASH